MNPLGDDRENKYRLLYSDVKKVNLRRSFKADLYPFKHLNPFIKERQEEAVKNKKIKKQRQAKAAKVQKQVGKQENRRPLPKGKTPRIVPVLRPIKKKSSKAPKPRQKSPEKQIKKVYGGSALVLNGEKSPTKKGKKTPKPIARKPRAKTKLTKLDMNQVEAKIQVLKSKDRL